MDAFANIASYLSIMVALGAITYLCVRRAHWIAGTLMLGATAAFVLGIGRVVMLS